MKLLFICFTLLIGVYIQAQDYLGIEFMGENYEIRDMIKFFPVNEVDIDYGTRNSVEVTLLEDGFIKYYFGTNYRGEDLSKRITRILAMHIPVQDASKLYSTAKLQFGNPDDGYEEEAPVKDWQGKIIGTKYNKLLVYYDVYRQGDVVEIHYGNMYASNTYDLKERTFDLSYRDERGGMWGWEIPEANSNSDIFKDWKKSRSY